MERTQKKKTKQVEIDPRINTVAAIGFTNFRRIIKGLQHAKDWYGQGEGEKVLARRRANIAVGKVQVTAKAA